MVDNMALMYCGRFSVGGTQKAEADHETLIPLKPLFALPAGYFKTLSLYIIFAEVGKNRDDLSRSIIKPAKQAVLSAQVILVIC